MSRSEADWVTFSREHRVAYELAALVEPHGADKVQSGFTLTLYAAAPMDAPAGEKRQQAGRELWGELQALAQAAFPDAASDARARLEPPRLAVLRPENELKPEVALSWRLFHADHSPVAAEDRDRLAAFEKRLQALGAKRGRW